MAKKQGIEEMIEEADYAAKRNKRIKEEEASSREYGRGVGRDRQARAASLGALGTPVAYMERAGQFLGDKFDDADAYLSEKLGMAERAAYKRGLRQGLKDEGYKKGGVVSSASKRADGCAIKGKTRGKMV